MQDDENKLLAFFIFLDLILYILPLYLYGSNPITT
jgi:hypothetical protein